MEQLTMEQLIEKVEAWGRERGLDKTDPLKQYIKLVEEVSELGTAINIDDKAAQEDAIGDIMVVLTMLCMQVDGGNLISCLFEYLGKRIETDNFEDVIAFEAKCTGPYDALWCFVLGTSYIADIGLKLREHDMYFGGGDYYIGRVLSMLIEISALLNIKNIDECYRLAYEEIKDRKGKTIDGVFIKEADF